MAISENSTIRAEDVNIELKNLLDLIPSLANPTLKLDGNMCVIINNDTRKIRFYYTNYSSVSNIDYYGYVDIEDLGQVTISGSTKPGASIILLLCERIYWFIIYYYYEDKRWWWQ